jgi:hypothetical protein
MPRTPRSPKRFKISDFLGRQLNTYAQVACAAGVSVLALAAASEAEVVYTKTHQVTQIGDPLYIDLNNDGIIDFQLRTNFYIGTSGTDVALSAWGYHNANNVVAGVRYSRSGYFLSAASALRAGARIGPKGNFSLDFPLMAEEHFDRVGNEYSDLGKWIRKDNGVTDRYLGFKFLINGEVHYGWARVSVNLDHQRQYGDVSGTLTGYAYETIPDKAITAGQTTGSDVITVESSSLGRLALGRD